MKIRTLILLLSTSLIFSGVFLRKKNKCGDCPTWGKKRKKSASVIQDEKSNLATAHFAPLKS